MLRRWMTEILLDVTTSLMTEVAQEVISRAKAKGGTDSAGAGSDLISSRFKKNLLVAVQLFFVFLRDGNFQTFFPEYTYFLTKQTATNLKCYFVNVLRYF